MMGALQGAYTEHLIRNQFIIEMGLLQQTPRVA